MKTHINTNTDGKGANNDEQRSVIITKLGLGYQSTNFFPEDPWHGELRAYFDHYGFTIGSWNVDGHGLIMSDRTWIREFKSGLNSIGISQKAASSLRYSSLDRQGRDYVSLDGGSVFYTSWARLQAKLAKLEIIAV